MGNGELLFHGDRGEFGKIKRVLWTVAMVPLPYTFKNS